MDIEGFAFRGESLRTEISADIITAFAMLLLLSRSGFRKMF